MPKVYTPLFFIEWYYGLKCSHFTMNATTIKSQVICIKFCGQLVPFEINFFLLNSFLPSTTDVFMHVLIYTKRLFVTLRFYCKCYGKFRNLSYKCSLYMLHNAHLVQTLLSVCTGYSSKCVQQILQYTNVN